MPDKAPFAPRGKTEGTGWPSFRTGPNGERRVFNSPDEVPEGWHDGSVAAKVTALAPKIEPEGAAKLPPAKPGHEWVQVTHEDAAAIHNAILPAPDVVHAPVVTPTPSAEPTQPLAPRRLARTRGAFKPDEAAE